MASINTVNAWQSPDLNCVSSSLINKMRYWKIATPCFTRFAMTVKFQAA
ncbi:MAG: hypothetical protein IKN18_01140 [Neisseriaceae bacterium]|nr:hypothetical protein [Neisseriaceae bacterium]